MQILKILKFVEENTNSALFYTPNIISGAKSYLFKTPHKILSAKTLLEVDEVLAEVDELSQDPNLVGFATLPYEIGYYFQPKDIKNSCLGKNALRFIFYKREDVEIIKSNDLEFQDVENYLLTKNNIKDMKLDISRDEYVEKINKIKNYIEKGDTYQINFTTKAKFNVDGELISLFMNGIFNQSASYSVIINSEKEFILSFSPELFFKTDYQKIIAKPMKGTLKRIADPIEDKKLAKSLLNDEKNLAENVMIVDLMRNDIGKIAETDSVKVEKLYEIEKYETLYQLTSTVIGELKEKKLSSIIKNLYPSGSITGAPKIRSMQIIAELEKAPRNLYTGSIGLISNEEAIFNIPIRTVTINKSNKIGDLGLGSGIVWDSDAASEYDEVLLKGQFISEPQIYFELLETILFENGNYFLLDYHLARLKKSSEYFLFNYNETTIVNNLLKVSEEFDADKKYRIRFLLNKWGKIKLDYTEINLDQKKLKIVLNNENRCESVKYLYHKTTHRPWDQALAKAKLKGFDEVIFINKSGFLLEGAISNLLIEKNGQYFTPPQKLGILNGCYRQYLLDQKKCREKMLRLEDFLESDKIILCNSVRGEMIVSHMVDLEGKTII